MFPLFQYSISFCITSSIAFSSFDWLKAFNEQKESANKNVVHVKIILIESSLINKPSKKISNAGAVRVITVSDLQYIPLTSDKETVFGLQFSACSFQFSAP
jgi:hypothetical protein